MKPRNVRSLAVSHFPLASALVMTLTAGATASAATVIWDGGPASTGTNLGLAENWTGDVLPSVATPDTAQWNGVVPGTLSLVYGDAAFAGASPNTGLNLELTALQTDAVAIDSGSNTGALRINNITVAAGAGALTLGNGADVLNLTLGGAASTQTFTNNSANAVSFGSDTVLGLGGGGNHLLAFTGSGNWSVASNLAFASGGQAALYKTGAGTLTLSNGGAFKEGPNVNGGTFYSAVLKEGATVLSGGTFTNNITTNNGEFVVGGLDTVGTNTSLTVSNATVVNGIDWFSIGRGNGVGTTTSDVTLNDSASVTSVNMSLGFNGGNAATAPKGSVKLNGTSALTVTNTVNIAESPNSNFLVELNGTSTFKQTANASQTRIGGGDGAVGTLKINGGAATFERDLVFGYGGTGTGRLTLDSGTLNVATTLERWLKVNELLGSKGELTINGGTINLNTNSDLRFSTSAAAAGTSFVTLAGGAITGHTGNANGVPSGTSVVDLNQGSTNGLVNNTFNLNGGTLTIGQIVTTQDSGTAAFNFNGGTLKAGAASGAFVALGGASQSAKVLAGGAKIDTNGFNVTIPEPLVSGVSGDGGLTKSGTGNLTLTGANTYVGATSVTGGTLTLTGSTVTTTSGITVNGSGAKLVVAGFTVQVPVTLTQGSLDTAGTIDHLTVANNAANTLTTGNGANGTHFGTSITFQGAATLNVQATGMSMDRYFQTTDLATSAAGAITVNAVNTQGVWTSGTDYPVIEFFGSYTGNVSHFTLGTVPGLAPNQTAALVNTGSSIAIRITGESLVWTGQQSAHWTTAAVGGSRNWNYQGNGIEFTNNSAVTFDDTAAGYSVNLASNVAPSVTLFSNDANDYVLASTGGFGITSGSFVKNGFAKLTIGTSNTYTGATIVNGGIVAITGAGSIAASSSITLASGTELALDPSAAITYANPIAGDGLVRKQGTSALTLSGANTFTSDLIIEGGPLNLNSATAAGNGPGVIRITGGGIIDNTSGADLVMTPAKPQAWDTDITFTGTHSLSMGGGAVTLGGTGTSRTVNVAAGTLGTGGISSTTHGLVKTGPGDLRLSGVASVLQAPVEIQAGIIGIGEDLTATGLSGAGILENGTANTKWGYWNINTDQSTGTLIRDGAGVGRLGIVKRGTATWTLTNNSNSATGNLTVDNGRLILNNTGTYGATGPAAAVITNLTSAVGTTAAANGVLEINGATVNYKTMNNADGAAFRGSLSIGTNGTGAGAVLLNSGSLTTYRQLAVGTASGSYGGFTQTGGTTSVGGFLAIGLGTGSGVFTQTGGTYTHTTSPITNGAGAGSNGVMRLTGNAVFNINGTGDNGLWLGEAGSGRLSVSGNAALTIAPVNNGLQLGRGAAGTGIANLLGGNVTTPAVTKGAGTGTLNFNGGTLTANAASATFLTGLTNAYVHQGGGTLANGGNAITIAQPLLAPAGNGVSAAGLTASGSGFIAPPVVTITGDGSGATAVAEIDAGGNLTGITITNPGTGYTTPPVFALVGGGIGNTGSIGGTATLIPNTSGGLTFTGAGTTTLSGANTYTGNTTVASGTTLVVAATTGSLTFRPGAPGVSNKVTGAGSAFFYGAFNIDTTGAAIANGNTWTLVDAGTRLYDPIQFTIPGFTQASDVWTKTEGNNTWTFTEATGVLSLSVGTATGYSSWASTYGLGANSEQGDPDNDGIRNLMEYVLGGIPNVANTSILPTQTLDATHLVLTFRRSDLSESDTTVKVQWSADMTTWTDFATIGATSNLPAVQVAENSPGAELDTITVTIPRAGREAGGKLFARVQATK